MTVFAAIADNNRRAIFDLLIRNGGGTATSLASSIGITRQATAKHLAILADAGLASRQRIGRETRFLAVPTGLDPLRSWVESTAHAWDNRLDDLDGRFER